NSVAASQYILFAEPAGANALGKGAGLQLYAGGSPGFTKGNGDGSWKQVASNIRIPAGEWHHVAGTYDGASLAIYVDGILGGTLANSQGIDWTDQAGGFPSPAQLYLGAFKTNQLGAGATIPDGFMDGKLDEVEIFDRALSSQEVAALP